MNADAAQTRLVPETITLVPPDVVTVRPLHWLLAFPYSALVLLMPRRFGPRAIESGWFNALLVHFLSALVFFGCMASYMDAGEPPAFRDFIRDFSLYDELRRPFTGAFTVVFLELRHWQEAVAIAIGIALAHFAFWAAAVLLEPFVAIGETRWHAYSRAVRALLWATACAWPMGWILPLLVNFVDRSPMVALLLFLAWLTWWLSVIVRVADRYGGPQRGARWEPRPVLCEACGYTLANLPIEGRCPECGAEIAASLPENRKPSVFAAARGFGQRICAFPVMLWRSSRSERFLADMPVWNELRPARRFSLYVAVCVGVLAAAFFGHEFHQSFYAYSEESRRTRSLAISYCVVWAYGVFAVIAWMLIASPFATKLGFSKFAPRGTVICYATGFLLLPTVLFGIGYHACQSIGSWYRPVPAHIRTPLGEIEKEAIVITALLMPAFVALIVSWLRVRHMLRLIRFANA